TIGYDYDDAGQLTDMSGPMGSVSYTHDPAGRVATLTNELGITDYTWTPGGRQESIERPNGTTTSHSYDPAGRLVGVDHTGSDGTIASFDYTLDAAGNRVGVDTHTGSETYVVDELNRLTQATYADGTSESFGYDPAGNRTSHTDPDGTTTYSYDPAGQLDSSSGPDGELTYDHDPAGRLTAISDGTTYTYNTAGQLTEATVDGATHTYTYDGDGIRVGVDGQDQLWDRNGSLPMLVDDGQSHTWGPDGNLLTTGDAWAHTDALGSIRAHTDTSGTATTSIDYQAFGEPTSGWDSFGYTGGIHDPSGLIHLRARQLDPDLGRFTTRDPVQPGAPGTGGYNHYTYTANNPTTYTDPTGQMAEAVIVRTIPRRLTEGEIAALGIAAGVTFGVVVVAMLQDLRGDSPQRNEDPNDDPRPVPPTIPDPTRDRTCTDQVAVARLGSQEECGDQVVSYRGVDGNPGCESGLSLGPSAFRLDPDGVSTFERPYQGSVKPCLVPFAFRVPDRSPGASGTVAGLSQCTATHTPNFGVGHWSINCAGDTRQMLSTYAKGLRNAGRIEKNELHDR
ncbi:MAG: RHS repeat-associated core domain-containing protein, partial [Acidimicrobiales bacterium]